MQEQLKQGQIQEVIEELVRVVKEKKELESREKALREQVKQLLPPSSKIKVGDATVSVYIEKTKVWDEVVQAQLKALKQAQKALLREAEEKGQYREKEELVVRVSFKAAKEEKSEGDGDKEKNKVKADFKMFYTIREYAEDLIEEARAEAPTEILPQLEEALEKVKKAKSLDELLPIFDMIGMGRDHAMWVLRTLEAQ